MHFVNTIKEFVYFIKKKKTVLSTDLLQRLKQVFCKTTQASQIKPNYYPC